MSPFDLESGYQPQQNIGIYEGTNVDYRAFNPYGYEAMRNKQYTGGRSDRYDGLYGASGYGTTRGGWRGFGLGKNPYDVRGTFATSQYGVKY